jgi:6-phosphogluconolactonase (cycloisomerase 2 family)
VTAVAVHPSGKFVFATRDENAAGDGVAVFQVQNNGSLKAAPGSPYSTQNGPQALVVDATGKYLYVAEATDYIDAFEIDQTTGALTPLPGSPYKLSTPNPSCSAFPFDIINPLGKYLYTANAFNDSISGYTIEKTTGTLTQIAGSPWPDEGGCAPICPPCAFNPEALAVDGSGKFLYGINGDMEEIAIYSINSSGALNFVKYTPNTSACSGPIRTDITGNYIYAFGCGFQSGGVGSSIAAFAINHSTGDLSPLPSSPYPVIQGYPLGLTVTP